MKKSKKDQSAKGAFEIIEEATRLLRVLPAGIHMLYYIGSMPFVLAFLYFWADMSRGAWALQNLSRAAFLMTAAYIWMKCWQAVYCARMRAALLGEEGSQWTARRLLRLVAVQTALQPIGFIALPVASVLLLPFAWVYAFFHNVSVLGWGQTSDIRAVYREAGRQAKLFPAQNHIFIMIYSLCGIVVFLNLMTLIYLFPRLLSTFMGIETSFSRTTWGMFNTTLLTATAGLTYLVLNPLAKAVYVLRCFYGESLHTGADLKVELRKYAGAAKVMVAAVLLGVLMLASPTPAKASESAPAGDHQTAGAGISASELNRSIDDVISQREYGWRLPRVQNVSKEKGVIDQFFSGLVDTIGGWLKPVKKWIEHAFEWLSKKLVSWMKGTQPGKAPAGNWKQAMRIALLVMIVVAIGILIVVMWRVLRAYRRVPAVSPGPAVPVPATLHEDVLADELPADRWLKMAEDLMRQGDLRAALRAFYLASLSLLARKNVIIIARFKSNREYERELYRKAHHAPDLLAAFSGNMRIYEGTWYGMHAITEETVRHFRENQTRIMTIANKI